jgi:cell division protein FtsB
LELGVHQDLDLLMQMVILEIPLLLFVNLLQVVEVVEDQLVDNQLDQEVQVEAQVVELLQLLLDQEMLEVLVHQKETQEVTMVVVEHQM